MTMTAHKQSNADIALGSGAIDGDWMEAMPGERFAVRTSSDETNGSYAVVEVVGAPESGPSLHIHQNEDEHFVILEGTVCFVCGDLTFNATAGTSFTVPKGVQHTWANLSESDVRMLGTFVPGGLERCFPELAGASAGEVEAIANAYGCLIVGPPIRR
jgi:mannose-6-phosphate isomerase-like protein (cupin superfamily)